MGGEHSQPVNGNRAADRVRTPPQARGAGQPQRWAPVRAARAAPLLPRRGGSMSRATAARTALALDELYRDPRGRELIAALNEQLPTAAADQRRAAARDAHSWLEFEAPYLGAPVEESNVATLPEWLRLDLLSTWS